MLPHGGRDDAKVDQIELDAEIMARGGQAASLDGRERGAGGSGIAREHESSARGRVHLQPRDRIAVGMTERECLVFRTDARSRPDVCPDT